MKVFALLFFLAVGCRSPLLSHGEREQALPTSATQSYLHEVGLFVHFEWQKGPSLMEAGGDVLWVSFAYQESDFAADLLVVPDLRLEVSLWMPHHGHGSAPVSIEKQKNGFLIKEIYFIMPGFWEVHFKLKRGQDVVESFFTTLTL